MLSSNSSLPPRNTSDLTVRAWLRTPFGPRGERSRPTRPNIEHGHELVRYQSPPLV